MIRTRTVDIYEGSRVLSMCGPPCFITLQGSRRKASESRGRRHKTHGESFRSRSLARFYKQPLLYSNRVCSLDVTFMCGPP